MKSAYLSLFLVVCIVVSSQAKGDEPIRYNRDVRPILAEYCFACHGVDSAARKADLRLDDRQAAIDAGAIEPGKPDDSEMIARIITDDPEMRMPPPETRKNLSEQEKAVLRRWIAAGAVYEKHWSLIPPTKPEPPATQRVDWAKNPIDNFVLHRLEQQELVPAPEAAPNVLFRRLHLDITGLPPRYDDVVKFTADYAKRGDAALSEWIDRLMSLPGWGEHRARYWLDAARYGDTHGLHFDNYREIWPYRDWVIRAFNRNQPFDQFIIEQIAGDLLPNPTDDQLIATGFQRCNITTNEGGTIDEENLANYAADRVQTFGWVFLGMTTNCGQCHDHKFDHFTMRDYYSLAAFFRNTTQGPKDGNVKDGRGPVLVVPNEEDRPRWKALPAEITRAKAERDACRQSARQEFEQWLTTVSAQDLSETVSAENLVAHLPLNEGRGHAVHNLVDHAPVKAIGKLTWTSEGQFGPAPVMSPEGTLELGKVGDFERHERFSYGAWLKPADNRTSGGIIARMDQKHAYRGWDLWQNGNSYSVHIIDTWSENAIKVTTAKPTVTPGKWQHVFATYDGSGKPSGIRIYIDGKPQKLRVDTNSLKPDASIRTQVPTRIGQRNHGQHFRGAVQDVRIYARQLGDNEVLAIAQTGPLQTVLSLPPEKRTQQHESALFEYYLAQHHPKYPKLAQRVAQLEAEREAIRARSPVTHIQQEKPNSEPTAYILIRGQYDKKGDLVHAATPEALHPMPKDAPKNRLGLAYWLVDESNPLTVRVTVNRFWQQVFGQGIVATPEDFGVMGAPPTHPDLLDWLAVDFREHGWDVKRFFKQIFMSATYRQAPVTTPEKLEQDPQNALLSRGPRFRMDAEMIRDYALAVSGLLSRRMFGPGVKPYQPENIWDIVGLPGGNTRKYVQDHGENLYRRTIYTFWKRMAPPPNLEAFNAPSREVCTVRRERTDTPLQALVTLNDPTFVEAARKLAECSMAAGQTRESIAQQIAQRTLARPFSHDELKIVLKSYGRFYEYYADHPSDAQALIAVGESKRDEKLDPVELASWTMVSNQVLNLDEVLNK